MEVLAMILQSTKLFTDN